MTWLKLSFSHFQPFVDEEQVIHRYFPDKYYAVALPLLAGVIGLALIGKSYCKNPKLFGQIGLSKQCRTRSDCSRSEFTLFAISSAFFWDKTVW